MTTIRDIVEQTGLSLGTISRVLNNSGYTSQRAREKVEKVVKELNYIPHMPAKSLASKTTRMVGLVIPDVANPVYSEIARGVYDTAKKYDYHVLAGNTYGNSIDELDLLKAFYSNRVSGLILLAPEIKENEECNQYLASLSKEGVVILISGRYARGLKADRVSVDNTEGAYQAANYLVHEGHKRIAHISGSKDTFVYEKRLSGYRQGLEKNGLSFDESLVVGGDFSLEGGQKAVKKLLGLSKVPTAIFAANDITAIGAMLGIEEAGLKIPGDIAIVGFDDITFARLAKPSLTTVAQPKYETGQIMVERLIGRITGKIDEEPKNILMKPELIVRDSA